MTERGAGAGVRLRRAEVGPEFAGCHPAAQLEESSLPEVGPLAARGLRGEVAVEEDWDPGLAGDRPGDGERLVTRGVAIAFAEPDDRADVERPDAGVRAIVRAHVDRHLTGAEAADEGLAERLRPPAERQNGSVVDRVRVRVEELNAT